MSWIATAIVASSYLSYRTSQDALDATEEGYDEASSIAEQELEESRRQFEQLRADYEPFRQTGLVANEQINQLLSGDFSGFMEDPGRRYQLEQGEKAVNRLASSQGRLNTGSQTLDYMRNAQGLANQSYGDYFNRLLNISGRGQSATGGVANASANYMNQYGNTSNNLANNALLSAQNRASSYQNLGNIGNNALNQYMMWQGYQNQGSPSSYYGGGNPNVPGDAFSPAYGY